MQSTSQAAAVQLANEEKTLLSNWTDVPNSSGAICPTFVQHITHNLPQYDHSVTQELRISPKKGAVMHNSNHLQLSCLKSLTFTLC